MSPPTLSYWRPSLEPIEVLTPAQAMAFQVNYDSSAAAYDRRYLINDYSGVERTLTAFTAIEASGRVLEVGRVLRAGPCNRQISVRRIEPDSGVDARTSVHQCAHN